MIQTKNFGQHKDVLTAEFGDGNICFTKAFFPLEDKKGQSFNRLLLFSNNKTPRKIGEVSNEDQGKGSDEMERPEFIFEFKNPESITALVHSLIELQKDLFDYQEHNKE